MAKSSSSAPWLINIPPAGGPPRARRTPSRNCPVSEIRSLSGNAVARVHPNQFAHCTHESRRHLFAKTRQPWFPLPAGEGQGEGERIYNPAPPASKGGERKTNSSMSFHPH